MSFEFRTSSTCTYNNNDPRCLEIATNVRGSVALRDSKTGGTLVVTAEEWRGFSAGVKAGEFDLSG